MGLTGTAMLIMMWFECNGKAGLKVLRALRRPLSMASCSLKAYGLKCQRGAGGAWAILLQYSGRVLLQGTPPLSRKGERAGTTGGQRTHADC